MVWYDIIVAEPIAVNNIIAFMLKHVKCFYRQRLLKCWSPTAVAALSFVCVLRFLAVQAEVGDRVVSFLASPDPSASRGPVVKKPKPKKVQKRLHVFCKCVYLVNSRSRWYRFNNKVQKVQKRLCVQGSWESPPKSKKVHKWLYMYVYVCTFWTFLNSQEKNV